MHLGQLIKATLHATVPARVVVPQNDTTWPHHRECILRITLNFEPCMFLFCGADTDIVLTSRSACDHDFVHRCELNFESVHLGASDWVDPDLFVPISDASKEYDVAMVAGWAAFKRHNVFFRSLAALHPKKLRVALIGYPWDLTRRDIEQAMSSYGVQDQCHIFECIPSEEVAGILARSKVAIHISKTEGTNKSTFEALCCDTPIIVYRHNIGFPMESINSRTGVLADDYELPGALDWMVDNYARFSPRQWVLAHTGYIHATRLLNTSLRGVSEERGLPWTRDIVTRANYSNPRYKFDADRLTMASAYDALIPFLQY